MKKSSIVYFCIGCVCVLCVPVMAYIYLPVAFVYLLPAAVFFYLSRDFILHVTGKLKEVIVPFLKTSGTNIKQLFTKKETTMQKDTSAEPEVMKQEENAADENDPGDAEKAVNPTEETPEPAENVENTEDATISDKPVSDDPADKENEKNDTPSADTTVSSTDGQITIDESMADAARLKEEESKEKPEEVEKETAVEGPKDETRKKEPADEVEETAIEEPKDEAVKEEPKEEVKEEAKEEPKAEQDEVSNDIADKNEMTVVTLDDDETEKEPSMLISGIKNRFNAVFSKASSFRITNNQIDRSDRGIEENYTAGRSGDGAFTGTPEWVGSRKDQNVKELDIGDAVQEIRKQFDNLDMITTSAIAIMLSDTKTKAASPYIRSLKKPDIRVLLLKFCQESYFATDIEQLNKLFSKSYYKWKVFRYLGRITVFVKRGISDTLPRRYAMHKARITKNRFINKICETINTFESVKFISALSGNDEISDSKRNYKLDHLSENYKDALIYLVDVLLTCTCISKMLFVERMIKRMNDNSEFKKIIENMTHSIDDHNLIINKSRPIYKQYYQSELGYINGDDLLYGMAITIMVNHVKKVEINNKDILDISTDYKNTRDFNQDMLKWLDSLGKDDNVSDIGTLILQKINLSIHDNYGLLTNALQELTNWENYYDQRVSYYKKARDRERYLKGDFEKEKEELVRIK